ncbi:MAG: DNA repair protein RecO [Oscillospiraceae bacterium]|nr:DNA repair protein RecO [Oscillospiraceae bacterium]
MYKTTKALVLREVQYREADKLLTVLTEDEGKLTVKAGGALRKSCRYSAASQAFSYSEMTLFGNRGRWSLNEAETIEQFLPLRAELGKLALATYFAEVLEAVADEDSPQPALLQLGLNSLHALSTLRWTPEHIKAVFELRCMCLAGYEPMLDREGDWFSLRGGCFHAAGQSPGEPGLSLPAGTAARRAMAFIVSAPAKRIFSFSVPEEAQKQLAAICEQYVSAQLERGFSTLDYWKTLRL